MHALPSSFTRRAASPLALALASLLGALHAPADAQAPSSTSASAPVAAASAPAATAPSAPLPGLTNDVPPRAVPGDLVTDYSGVKVADPYRALEDLKSPTTVAWAAGQAAYTRARLDALPGLAALKARIDALDADRPPVVAGVQVTASGRWFYEKRGPSEAVMKLYVRDSATGADRLLLDPERWLKETGHRTAIDNYTASPDGKSVAVVVSVDDAELGELRLYDVATGRQIREPVPGIWGELAAAWSRDSRSVMYAQGLGATQPGGEPFGRMRIHERRLDGGEDRVVLGFGLPYGPEVRSRDWIYADPTSTKEWTIVGRSEGVSAQSRVAIARTASLRRDPAHAAWLQLFDNTAGVDSAGAAGHWLYVRSFVGAPRYHVMRYDLAHPDHVPVDIAPQKEGVIDDISVSADGLYFVVRAGSLTELWFLPHGAKAGSAKRVALPFAGAVSMFGGNADVPGTVFALEGWTRDRTILRAVGTKATATTLLPASTSTIGADWEADSMACTSHDGVKVPMIVLHKRGLAKDGQRPTHMIGYGGYGLPEPAFFNRKAEAWLERGGVLVDVDPRGGGAYGREWYQAGVGAKKSNTWKDMIACGQALIDLGWTSRAKLAIEGTSMGGVAVGRAVTERPDLFAVGIVRVGITDAVRFIEATDNGPNHEFEMGTVKTADGIRQLLAMSTYANVRDGEKYPAMLFTAGMNDNRVAPWVTFKTFSRMAAASASGRPVLLRVEAAGGHGVTTTAQQRNAELADRWAFTLWNMGDPAFQPAAQVPTKALSAR